jgi:hypothetical protein
VRCLPWCALRHRCAVVTPQVLSQVRHKVHGPRPACANRQLVVITDCRRHAPSACSVGLLRPPAQICSSEYWQHCNSAMHMELQRRASDDMFA